MTTPISQTAAEAERIIGHLPEPTRRVQAEALAKACEAHWRELRGPEPGGALAHTLWSVTPPLADLFADLYAEGSPRLEDALRGHTPERGLALLVQHQIAHGDAEGARIAFEAMMVFQSTEAAAHYAQRIAQLLRGGLEQPPLHPHSPKPPLSKALTVLAAHTGRCDLKAVVEVIRLLTSADESPDESLVRLRHALGDQGIHFAGIEDNHIRFHQHGHAHKPVSLKHLGDALAEIREARLARAPTA